MQRTGRDIYSHWGGGGGIRVLDAYYIPCILPLSHCILISHFLQMPELILYHTLSAHKFHYRMQCHRLLQAGLGILLTDSLCFSCSACHFFSTTGLPLLRTWILPLLTFCIPAAGMPPAYRIHCLVPAAQCLHHRTPARALLDYTCTGTCTCHCSPALHLTPAWETPGRKYHSTASPPAAITAVWAPYTCLL